jgi:hypothetical protein
MGLFAINVSRSSFTDCRVVGIGAVYGKKLWSFVLFLFTGAQYELAGHCGNKAKVGFFSLFTGLVNIFAPCCN